MIADGRARAEDLVLALVRHVPEGARVVHVGDQQLGAQRRVLLDVELAPDVAEDVDLVDVEVAGLRVGRAVGALGLAEDADDLVVDAEVEQGGGDAGEGDDALGRGLAVDLLAAVVGELPGAAPLPAAGFAVARPPPQAASRAASAAAPPAASRPRRESGRAGNAGMAIVFRSGVGQASTEAAEVG